MFADFQREARGRKRIICFELFEMINGCGALPKSCRAAGFVCVCCGVYVYMFLY